MKTTFNAGEKFQSFLLDDAGTLVVTDQNIYRLVGNNLDLVTVRKNRRKED